ncbi:MAG: putative membrane protein [Arenicella sp.]|jgi:uncharacterized membrane protein
MVISQEILVQQSPEVIFNYYVDFTKHHEFIGLLQSCRVITEEPFELGSQFIESGDSILGGLLEMKSEVIRFEPNERVTCVSIDGGNKIEQDLQIQAQSENESLVIFTTTVTPPKTLFGMVSGMASGLVKSKVEEQMVKDSEKFKQVLEQMA